MATRRMVPTNFFKDPDILNLSSNDTRLILLGLILYADDEGRELAHAALLGREWDYPAEQVESALADLAENDLITLYQVGKHRYYSLKQWGKWQTINPKRMTPSKYPAPPAAESSHQVPDSSREMQTHAGETPEVSGEMSAQLNLIESNLIEEEGSNTHPSNVVPFPSKHSDGDNEKKVKEMTGKLAQILTIPITPDLRQLVCDFLDDRTLSLLGEAYAAREYLDDPQRNHKRKKMTPAFFRNWLKREQGSHPPAWPQSSPRNAAQPGQTMQHPPGRATSSQASATPRRRSLMGLGEEYERARRLRDSNQGQREEPPHEGSQGSGSEPPAQAAGG